MNYTVGVRYANLKQQFEQSGDFSPPTGSIVLTTASNFMLRAGDSRRFLGFPLTADNVEMWKAFDRVRFSELSYRVCYCSVFDECWVTHLTNLQAEPVKQCPIPAVPFGELAELTDG